MKNVIFGLLLALCVSSMGVQQHPDGGLTFNAQEVSTIEENIRQNEADLQNAIVIIKQLMLKLSEVEKAKCI